MANQVARHLRKNQTQAEALLWSRVRAKSLGNYRFGRQHEICGFIVDFVCPERKLVIELDGSQHVDDVEVDIRRTSVIETDGFQILRFWNKEVFENLEGVLERILVELGGS